MINAKVKLRNGLRITVQAPSFPELFAQLDTTQIYEIDAKEASTADIRQGKDNKPQEGEPQEWN